MAVPVSVILERKGAEVYTIARQVSVATAAEQLADHGIGALVVSADGRAVEGIVSERDLVRSLAQRGATALELTVEDVMSAEVTTCRPDTTIDQLMALMTERRIRHIPVLDDGGLVGLVSIGDVVKTRLDELEVQAEALADYVTGSPSS